MKNNTRSSWSGATSMPAVPAGNSHLSTASPHPKTAPATDHCTVLAAGHLFTCGLLPTWPSMSTFSGLRSLYTMPSVMQVLQGQHNGRHIELGHALIHALPHLHLQTLAAHTITSDSSRQPHTITSDSPCHQQAVPHRAALLLPLAQAAVQHRQAGQFQTVPLTSSTNYLLLQLLTVSQATSQPTP